jgi:hypothetical protein
LDYYTDLPTVSNPSGIIKSNVRQSEINLQLEFTPGRKPIGYGVERTYVEAPYARYFVNLSQGLKGVLNSDFEYKKMQLYCKQHFIMGGIGRLDAIVEVGKTYGDIPLGLMNIVPGNQSLFAIENTFNLLNYYEFEADQYATIQLQHNFGGRIFSRIPFLRKLNWRETVGVKGVFGSISDGNRVINASNLVYKAPENGYWEYNAGIGNIFKVFKIEFSWRGSYIAPGTNNFGIKGSFGFYF